MANEQGPTTRIQQDAGASAWIARERERPGAPPWWFLLGAVFLGVGVAAVTIALGAQRGDALPGELAHRDGTGPFAAAFVLLGLDVMRVFSGIIAGATVGATAFAARRLAHSGWVGLMAGALVALDPSVLVDGQLAVPAGFLRFAAVGSLALALGGHSAWHWLAGIPLGAGIAMDARFSLWIAPLVALLWLRGHIYSAPKHLLRSASQVALIPLAVGFVAAWIAGGGTPSLAPCGPNTPWAALWLQQLPSYGANAVSFPNPVTWFGGLGLLVFLGLAAAWAVVGGFRITRAPGRVQMRLAQPLARLQGRSLWLLGIAAFAPFPAVWLPLGAIAVATGIHQLDKDSRGFAGAVAGAMLVFAVLFLARFGALLGPNATGDDLQALLDVLPWAQLAGCS